MHVTKATRYYSVFVVITLVAVTGLMLMMPGRAVTITCTGIQVSPGTNIQNEVNANPEGTIFCLRAGVHTRQSITPKRADQFIGLTGAVLDGQNATTYALYGNADNVVIRGLEIKSYTNPAQHGAIHAQIGPHDNPPDTDLSDGWLIENVDVHNNKGVGVLIAHRTILRNSRIHHNGQLGVTARAGDGALIDNVEIDNNNIDNWDTGWEAGGSKFKYTDGLTVRNSHIHDNKGTGLWTDIDNIRTTYEGNRIINNADAGIHHEISYDAIIRNNIISGNGAIYHEWLWGAGIQVQSSSNVEIYNNELNGNYNGISVVESGRGGGIYGTWKVANVSVHDNNLTNSGRTGAGRGQGLPPMFDQVDFQANTYAGYADLTPFQWNGLWLGWAEWRGYGLDISGNFSAVIKPGDVDNNGKIDIFDLNTILSQWGRTDKPSGDIDKNSKVDIFDLNQVLSSWGK